MTIEKNKNLGRKMLLLSASLLLASSAYASDLTIKNDDSARVEIIIEPGEGTVLPAKNEIRRSIDPGQEIKLKVTSEELGGEETFSVTGKVKVPSLYNKCGLLFVERDYKIVFTGAKTGATICTYQTLK